jgi:GAF domain-containing protein
MQAAFRARAQQQTALAGLAQMVLASGDVESFAEAAIEVLAGVLDCDFVQILRVRNETTLVLEAGRGWREGLVGTAVVECGDGSQAGYVLTSDEPAVVHDLAWEGRFEPMGLLRAHGVVSGMLVSIPAPGRPYGLLGVHAKRRTDFSDGDLAFLRSVANILGTAIELQKSRGAVEALVEATPDLVARYDQELRCVYANTNLMLATGRVAEDLLGRSPRELGLMPSPQLDCWR